MGQLSPAQQKRIAEIRRRVNEIEVAAYVELLGKLINSPIGLMSVTVTTGTPSLLQELVALQREYDAIMESGPPTFDPNTGTWTLPPITIRQAGTLTDQIPEIEISDNREDNTITLPEITIVHSPNDGPETEITIPPVIIPITDFDDPPVRDLDATISTDAAGNAVITIPVVVIDFALGQDAIDAPGSNEGSGSESLLANGHAAC
jgi:hypothetical protein